MGVERSWTSPRSKSSLLQPLVNLFRGAWGLGVVGLSRGPELVQKLPDRDCPAFGVHMIQRGLGRYKSEFPRPFSFL